MDANEIILWKMGLMGGSRYRSAKQGKGGASWSSYWETQINEWQTPAGDIQVSGYPTALWSYGLDSMPQAIVATDEDFLFANLKWGVRTDCLIKKFSVHVYYRVDNASWKIKLLRQKTTAFNYECIASADFTPAGTGVVNAIQTFTLSTPFTAKHGDVLGIYVPKKHGMFALHDLYKSQAITRVHTTDQLVGAEVDYSTIFRSDTTYIAVPVAAFSDVKPYSVFLGDSIFGGGNGFTFPVDGREWATDRENAPHQSPGGEIGDLDLTIPHRMSVRFPSAWRYQNFAMGGSKFSDIVVANDSLARAVAVLPKTVFIHCGVNDLSASRTWEQISPNLDTIRTAFPEGTIFYLDEIMPQPTLSENETTNAAKIAMNANFKTYCETYEWTLVECFNEMSVNSGAIKVLNPAFSNGDSVHLNDVGADKLADIIASYFHL